MWTGIPASSVGAVGKPEPDRYSPAKFPFIWYFQLLFRWRGRCRPKFAKNHPKVLLTTARAWALNVSRLSGRSLAHTQLKRLSAEIPKNGETQFSSSIPLRNWAVQMSVQEPLLPAQTVQSRRIAGILRSTPAGTRKNTEPRDPALERRWPNPAENARGKVGKTGWANGEIGR